MSGRNAAGKNKTQSQAQSQSQSQSQPQSQGAGGYQQNLQQMMQQRFASSGATPSFSGTGSFTPNSTAGANSGPPQQQQQRMLQLQIQQRHLQMQQLQQQQKQIQTQQQQSQQPGQSQKPAQQKKFQAGLRSSSSNASPSPASLQRPSAVATASSNTSNFMRGMPSPSAGSIGSTGASVSSIGKSKKSSSVQASPAQQAKSAIPQSNAASSVVGSPRHPKSASSPLGKSQTSTTKGTTAAASSGTAPTSAGSGAHATAASATAGDAAAIDSGPTAEQITEQQLAQCDWKDKCLWVSRQLLGGNATNGFLRSTATVQRIKRQRARQSAQSKQKSTTGTNPSEAPSLGTGGAPSASSDAPANSGEQDAKGNPSKTSDAGTAPSAAAAAAAAAAGKKREANDQEAEESLKKEVMNPRTAKKIKYELELGMSFCVQLHNTIRSLLVEMDPTIASRVPLPLHAGDEDAKKYMPMGAASTSLLTSATPSVTKSPLIASAPTSMATAAAITSNTIVSTATVPATATTLTTITSARDSAASSSGTSVKMPINPPGGVLPAPPLFLSGKNGNGNAIKNKSTIAANPQQNSLQRRGSESSVTTAASTNATVPASPGNPNGSTLRKYRKKKLPPSNEPPLDLKEFDDNGKRLVSRKEHNTRIFETLRFRALKQGDLVAARTTSRDLWILARVLKDFPGHMLPPAEFLKLSEARRDSLFREKVSIKDVEDKTDGGATLVARNLVLPLPRSYSEASEWCQRVKKGARVYAMYPQTTSLYSASVTDSTTYCRDDDDIVVVEFDGEELDAKGNAPKYHIPARFVTMIPREFPGSQITPKNKRRTAGANSILPPRPSTSGGLVALPPPSVSGPGPAGASLVVAPTVKATASSIPGSTGLVPPGRITKSSSSIANKLGFSVGAISKTNKNSSNANTNSTKSKNNNKSNKSNNEELMGNLDLDESFSGLMEDMPYGELASSDSLDNLDSLDFDFSENNNSSSKLSSPF